MNYGDVLPDRFWEKVVPEPMSGCWLWVGAQRNGGYGFYWDGEKRRAAHRLVCTLAHGDGGDLHTRHSCDTRACVNPDHLSWGTPRDNTQDMLRRGRGRHSHKTTCPHGHPYDFVDSHGARACRTCARAAVRRASRKG